MSVLWTEKYRPKDVTSFESLPHIKNLLKMNEPNDFPNLLLYGPPGTGKTTFAHLLASTNKLELNASDERGINVIRDKIKSYASTLTKNKTIILDECENLTEDAQHCLRRIIEDSKNTRFIFTTNYLSKVTAPLKSRLVKLKFEVQQNSTLKLIGKEENLKFSDEFYTDLFTKCNHDLRRSINVLQGLAPLQNNMENEGPIEDIDSLDVEDPILDNNLVDDIIGLVPKNEIKAFKKITKENYKEFTKSFIFKGYSVLQFIYQLVENDIFTKEDSISKFNLMLAEMEEKLVIGCSDEVVLTKICLSKLKY
ncbi:hypothetical protein P3W45_001660 [Vairimorpha bombi]|jgi:replication factor C subunit 2/4